MTQSKAYVTYDVATGKYGFLPSSIYSKKTQQIIQEYPGKPGMFEYLAKISSRVSPFFHLRDHPFVNIFADQNWLIDTVDISKDLSQDLKAYIMSLYDKFSYRLAFQDLAGVNVDYII